MSVHAITVESLAEHRVAATGRCVNCEKPQRVEVLEDQLMDWYFGEDIQSVMPEVSVEGREWLISGLCGACFDAVWKDLPA